MVNSYELIRAWETAIRDQRSYESEAATELRELIGHMNQQIGKPWARFTHYRTENDPPQEDPTGGGVGSDPANYYSLGNLGMVNIGLHFIIDEKYQAQIMVSIRKNGPDWQLEDRHDFLRIPLGDKAAAANEILTELRDGVLGAFDAWRSGAKTVGVIGFDP